MKREEGIDMTNDKKLMLLAGVLALGMLAGCSSASAASAASGMAANARIAISIFFILTEVLCATL